MVNGIIYRIINLQNGKSYIGKTKSHYGELSYGINRRFKQHKINAFIESRKNECPLFYNALRKYGVENFIIENLLECNIEDVDFFEIKMIQAYDSANRNFGYNIALGGRGRSVVFISEEVRTKISKAQSDINIKKVIRNNVLVGYKVRRRQNGNIYQKYFSSTINTPEKNLELSHQFISDIKLGKVVNNSYNRKEQLPTGITIAKDSNNKNVGYTCNIMLNRKKYSKRFSNSKFSMEEKLQFAIIWIEKQRNKDFSYISPYDISEEKDMKNITIAKNKLGKEVGYVVKIIRNKLRYKISFESSKLNMEEKYINAISWRNKQLLLLT
jgi:hypothetical protein